MSINPSLDKDYITNILNCINDCFEKIDFESLSEQIRSFLSPIMVKLHDFDYISFKRLCMSSSNSSTNLFANFIKGGKKFSKIQITDYLSFRSMDLMLYILAFEKQGVIRLKILSEQMTPSKDVERIKKLITDVRNILSNDQTYMFLHYASRILNLVVLKENMEFLLDNKLQKMKNSQELNISRISAYYDAKNSITEKVRILERTINSLGSEIEKINQKLEHIHIPRDPENLIDNKFKFENRINQIRERMTVYYINEKNLSDCITYYKTLEYKIKMEIETEEKKKQKAIQSYNMIKINNYLKTLQNESYILNCLRVQLTTKIDKRFISLLKTEKIVYAG